METFPVVEADTEQLKAIARVAVSHSVVIEPAALEKLLKSIESDIERYNGDKASVYLKVGNNPIRGYILVKEHWNLAHLFVLPEYQKQKVGETLLQCAIKVCRSGSSKGFIRVNSSLNAVGFYRRMGFTAYQPEKPVPSFATPLICWF